MTFPLASQASTIAAALSRHGIALGYVTSQGTHFLNEDTLVAQILQHPQTTFTLEALLSGDCGKSFGFDIELTPGSHDAYWIAAGFVSGTHGQDFVNSRARELNVSGTPPFLTTFAERKLIRSFLETLSELEEDVPLGNPNNFGALIGESPQMRELFALLSKVSRSDTTVFIQGENGTGKELVAKAIHENSPRSRGRFVAANCSAFNDNLLDSELFGHKRGAFTGATQDKIGLFEAAHNGTLFLDEIGDMTPSLQVKVLRVLQEGTLTPVGDTEVRHVDVRVIAATNRNLKMMVKEGTFREDLYYRINVIEVNIPPLRERVGDIQVLIQFFLQRTGNGKHLSQECLTKLINHKWPGNVRELQNEIERLTVLAGEEQEIDTSLLSPRIAAAPSRRLPTNDDGSLPDALLALERELILSALTECGWNKTRAAEKLKISRRNLIRLAQKHDLESLR